MDKVDRSGWHIGNIGIHDIYIYDIHDIHSCIHIGIHCATSVKDCSLYYCTVCCVICTEAAGNHQKDGKANDTQALTEKIPNPNGSLGCHIKIAG